MNKLVKALAVTAEVCGTEFSEPAAKAIAIRLSAYPVDAVLKALDKCQVEVHGRLSLAAIIDRIDDGRPSADEAWATAIQASDESATVVWTSETAKAYWSASSLLEEGDQVAARMAFKEAYNRELSDSRQSGMPVKWEVTLGHDKQQREAALIMASERNRISAEQAKGLLPYLENGEFPKEVVALANKLSAA